MFKFTVDPKGLRTFDLKYEYTEDGKPKKSSQLQIEIIKPCKEKIGNDIWNAVSDAALRAFRVLNIRDFGLFDFRVHEETGVAYLLEVGLFCSFGEASFVNKMVREAGYTDKQLLNLVVRRTVERKRVVGSCSTAQGEQINCK